MNESKKIDCTIDLSKEREFIETLLNLRFRFFVLLFSIVIGGAFTAKHDVYVKFILTFGTIVSWLLAFTLFRSQMKFDIIFKLLPEEHPAKIIDKLAKDGWLRYSMRRIIGYYLPAICCITLTVLAILALLGKLPKVN